MTILFEKYKNGIPTGTVAWVDDPDDFWGSGHEAEENRRLAREILQRMDESKKWRRVTPMSSSTASEPSGVAGPESYVAPAEEAPDAASMQHLSGPPTLSRESPTQADVRAWAKQRGIEVNPLGRVPKAVINQYLAEHEG